MVTSVQTDSNCFRHIVSRQTHGSQDSDRNIGNGAGNHYNKLVRPLKKNDHGKNIYNTLYILSFPVGIK